MKSHDGNAAPPLPAAANYRGVAQAGILALVASGFMLSGCGGGGGGGSTEPPAVTKPPTVQASAVSLNVQEVAPSSVAGKVVASDPQGLALTFAVATAPSAGTVSVDTRSGDFTYSVSGSTASSQDSFTVAVSNGKAAATASVTVQLKTDPLLVNQWHIRNAGASAFSTVLPAPGNDMNVAGAWAAGFSGKGIKVAVVDTGLEIAHEDLAANVDGANSFNFLTNGSDPTPAVSVVGHDHGTQVAGIIGSVAFNGKGGRGVAYNARLRGYNLLENFSVTNYAASMGGVATSADNAVFNASFGNPAPALSPFDQAIVSANANLNTLRGGLGAILVNAAGNAFVGFGEADDAQRCSFANRHGVSCGDPAQDTRLGGVTPIIVGAINADGKRSSYSTTGSSLWVSAPGGEYGFDSTYYDTSKFPTSAVKPAIVTTARSGCLNRDNAPGFGNALVTGNHRLALDCQYTAQMNGTSSAAPNTSATIAMMLEANPRLTARDVKFILAKTAKRIDPGLASVTSTDLAPGATVTLEQGWVRNGAGNWFSNWYGFGAVDASAAVAMAKSYASYLPAMKTSDFYSTTPRAGVTVPAQSAGGLVIPAMVNEPFTTVEQVIVFPNLEATPILSCNQIEVVSPSGTKSILLHAANGFAQTSVAGTRILSNAFYGEPINGTWKFTYFNFCTGQTRLSATQPQSFLFIGR